jgi:hypothetical protein
MLRPRPETLLNDLLQALTLSAHRYEEAAELLEGDAAGVVGTIGRNRRLLADRLTEAIRLHGDMPDALDPELVGIIDLALRASAWWQGRENLLRAKLAHDDERLAKLTHDVTEAVPDLREFTEAISSHLRDAENELLRLRVRD